ncbi:MAG: hypothetical protein Q7W16_02825 [Coriobacteriia bacterium]|nr:hypothetical protein [Coriobacteriia bacterium]
MANAFDTYAATGTPERGQLRRAAAWDLGLVAVVFMILWPSPALRMTAGLPWSIHIPIALASLFVTLWLYSAVFARVLRRTVGMYIADVGFTDVEAAARTSALALWSLGWTAALLPTAFGAAGPADPERGWSARLSALTLVSTRVAD